MSALLLRTIVLFAVLIFSTLLFAQEPSSSSIKGITRLTGDPYAVASVPEASKKFDEGTEMIEQGKYADALRAFKTSSKLDPGYVKAIDMIAVSFRRLNQLDSAEHYYKKSIEIYPEGTFAVSNLGVVYLMQQRFDEAVVCYEKQIQLNPVDPEGYYGLGNVNLQRGAFEQAVQSLVKAVKIYEEMDNPHLADGYTMLGVALLSQGKNEEGIAVIDKALAKGKVLPESLQDWIDARSATEEKDVSYSAEELKAMEPLVIVASELLLNTSPVEQQDERQVAAGNVLKWVAETPSMTMVITEELVPFIDNSDLLVAFVAAFAKTGIEGGTKLRELTHYVTALRAVSGYYEKYQGIIERNKAIEKLSKLTDKELKSYVKKNL